MSGLLARFRERNRLAREAVWALGQRPLTRPEIKVLLLAGVTDIAAHLGRALMFCERSAVRGLTVQIEQRRQRDKEEDERLDAREAAGAQRKLRRAKLIEAQRDEIRKAGLLRSARGNALRSARMKLAFRENVRPDAVYQASGGRCGICRQPVSRDEMQVDHIVPIAMGGEHSYANVQAAHKRCNAKKGARWVGGFETRPSSPLSV